MSQMPQARLSNGAFPGRWNDHRSGSVPQFSYVWVSTDSMHSLSHRTGVLKTGVMILTSGWVHERKGLLSHSVQVAWRRAVVLQPFMIFARSGCAFACVPPK